MAKLIGSPPFVGTQDGLTIYQLEGEQYYVRMQSSITGKRIKKDKAFAGFRESSSRLRIASRIASAVYRQFVMKEYPLYREMTGKAILWLKEGCSIPVVEARLQQAYISKCAVNEAEGRSYHASEVKQSCRKVGVKRLFRIPDAFKTVQSNSMLNKRTIQSRSDTEAYSQVTDTAYIWPPGDQRYPGAGIILKSNK